MPCHMITGAQHHASTIPSPTKPYALRQAVAWGKGGRARGGGGLPGGGAIGGGLCGGGGGGGGGLPGGGAIGGGLCGGGGGGGGGLPGGGAIGGGGGALYVMGGGGGVGGAPPPTMQHWPPAGPAPRGGAPGCHTGSGPRPRQAALWSSAEARQHQPERAFAQVTARADGGKSVEQSSQRGARRGGRRRTAGVLVGDAGAGAGRAAVGGRVGAAHGVAVGVRGRGHADAGLGLQDVALACATQG